MPVELLLSPHSSTPMYAQIVAQVRAKVMAGQWKPGDALPSIRELAGSCRVSVITVKRAYLELERAGVIETWQGKGSFVADVFDASRLLAAREVEAQLQRLLDAAAELGLGGRDLVGRVEAALAIAPDALQATKPNRRKSG